MDSNSLLKEEGQLLYGEELTDKLLSKVELHDHFAWYTNWALDGPDEVPKLDIEGFRKICDIFEDLFEHIRCQNYQKEKLTEDLMKDLSMLQQELDSPRKREKAAGRVKNKRPQLTFLSGKKRTKN